MFFLYALHQNVQIQTFRVMHAEGKAEKNKLYLNKKSKKQKPEN